MTSQGHPATIFRRAIATENIVAAELAARQLGQRTLSDALAYTALVALKDPARRSRAGARWLERWLGETPAATLEDAAIVLAYPGALGGPRHAQAVASLRGFVNRG